MERGPSPEGPDMCACGHARDRHGLTTKPEHRDGTCQIPGCGCRSYVADGRRPDGRVPAADRCVDGRARLPSWPSVAAPADDRR